MKSNLDGRILVLSHNKKIANLLTNALNAKLENWLVLDQHELSKCFLFPNDKVNYLDNPMNKYLNELFLAEEFYKEQIILYIPVDKYNDNDYVVENDRLIMERIIKECSMEESNTMVVFYNFSKNIDDLAELIEKTLFKPMVLFQNGNKLDCDFGQILF